MAPRETGWQFYLPLLRGDHSLNEVKAAKLDGLDGFRFASDEEIRAHPELPTRLHRPGRRR